MTRENWLYVFVGSQGIFAPARGIWACQEGISAGGVSGAGIAQARNCLLAHLPSVCLRACSTMFQKLLAMDLNNCQPQGWPLIGSHARNFSFSLLTCSLISLHEMKHTNCSALLIGSSLDLLILVRTDPRARGCRRCLQRSQEAALGPGLASLPISSHTDNCCSSANPLAVALHPNAAHRAEEEREILPRRGGCTTSAGR